MTKDDVFFVLEAALDGQGIARHWWETVGTRSYPAIANDRLGEIDATVKRLKKIRREVLNSGDSA